MEPYKQCPLLELPPEILGQILIACGPASSIQLACTCSTFNTIFQDTATWKAFLASFDYTDHDQVPPEKAKETALKHYCRSCDSIRTGVQMFYTGDICIACEYKNPDNQRRFFCLSRSHRPLALQRMAEQGQ